jgi:hypothetical protein
LLTSSLSRVETESRNLSGVNCVSSLHTSFMSGLGSDTQKTHWGLAVSGALSAWLGKQEVDGHSTVQAVLPKASQRQWLLALAAEKT